MWNEKKARKRIKEEILKGFRPKITNHSKEMDFSNLGPEDVRRVHGIHLFADITNFNDRVDWAGGSVEKQKRVIREISILRRIQTDLFKIDGVVFIQMQGARLHLLISKPYGDEKSMATTALGMAISFNSYLEDVFNDLFGGDFDFQGSIGFDYGESFICRIGLKGSRELISLGTCVNLAAKMIGDAGSIRTTQATYELLPDPFKVLFDSGASQIAGHKVKTASGLLWNDLEWVKDEMEFKYNPNTLKFLTKKYQGDLPLSEIQVSKPITKIELDRLSERNAKRADAVILFLDLDGFTKRIMSAEENEVIEEEIRNLHIIRREFHQVIQSDFDGITLQHIGDCVVATVHLPHDDEGKRGTDAVKTAIATQSSLEKVLSEELSLEGKLHISTGISSSTMIFSRVGKRDRKEIIIIGKAAKEAEDFQKSGKAQDLIISNSVYKALNDDEIKEHFKSDGGSWKVNGLTFDCEDENSRMIPKVLTKGLGTFLSGKLVASLGEGNFEKPGRITFKPSEKPLQRPPAWGGNVD